MSAGVQPSRGSGAVSAEYRGGREEAGCSGWRTWDVYMVEDYETEDCATHLAPWLRLHLPESDTGLEPSLIEKEIARRCPFYPVLTLDLLMQINGRPPVWISLRSEQGYRMPLGLVPAVRVRAKTPFNDVLGVRKGAAPPPKMVLIYEAEADHDIDVRTRVPDRILALHYGQCSSSILNEVQAKLPGYHFEVFQPGKSSQEWTWEKLSLSLEPLLSTDVLRIKAVPQQSTQDCVKVVPVAHETMETLVRRRRHLQEPKRVYDS